MGGIGVRDDENKQKIRAKIRHRGTQKSPLKIELRQGRRGWGSLCLAAPGRMSCNMAPRSMPSVVNPGCPGMGAWSSAICNSAHLILKIAE